MTSPFVPRALLAAVTPPLDYDSVAGDLYEEYTWRVGSAGRSCANRWYWSQAFRSVPSLLAYSRSSGSLAQHAATASIVISALFALLWREDTTSGVVHAAFPAFTGGRGLCSIGWSRHFLARYWPRSRARTGCGSRSSLQFCS